MRWRAQASSRGLLAEGEEMAMSNGASGGATTVQQAGSLFDYFRVARPDHWFKNVFMLAGVAAAMIYTRAPVDGSMIGRILLAFWATCCVASFNYIINEILDAPNDLHHPKKRYRPIPSGKVKIPPLLVMAAVFLGMGLAIGWMLFPTPFLASLLTLAFMGLVYNVPPVRSKDLPYLDAISESVNNPIRLCIGWFAVGAAMWPPSSLLVAYWAIGAFLMTAKRYAEYRAIGDPQVAGAYRNSFRYYTESSLLIAMIVYISCFMSMFGVLAAKYQTELLLAIPFIAVFIAWFFHLSFESNSIIQEPERIVQRPAFLCYSLLVFLVVVGLAVVDLTFLVEWLGLQNVKW